MKKMDIHRMINVIVNFFHSTNYHTHTQIQREMGERQSQREKNNTKKAPTN